ncbi:MAG: 8-oxoguanine DNA glycosylase [Clostridiales bacterium]|nr:8-oxoguanine DNA glycosylase [Clostridiales bacterium]
MEIRENNDNLEIERLANFHPQHIFECGQAFRWNWDGKGYTGVVGNRVARIRWDGKILTLEDTILEDFHSFWEDYFDLKTDYGGIIAKLSLDDPIMQDAARHGWGIRILNQDPWETVISFIISANNGIKRIKGIIDRLSERLGEKIPGQSRDYYMFPTVDALARADEGLLRECGCGYRGAYIRKTAQMVSKGQIHLETLGDMGYENAKEQLLKCPGIGPKVADCILLFSLGKTEAFPIDVWIKRIMGTLYPESAGKPNQVYRFAREKFGSLAGYAQQYLFYYAREKDIGK